MTQVRRKPKKEQKCEDNLTINEEKKREAGSKKSGGKLNGPRKLQSTREVPLNYKRLSDKDQSRLHPIYG